VRENIQLKTSFEIAIQRRACVIVEELFRNLKRLMLPGVTTREIDAFCENFLKEHGAVSALKGYKGFPGSVCISVNQVVAHGVPNKYKLKKYDIVTVDVTLGIDGWHCDGAWTFVVGEVNENAMKLIKASWQATMAGIGASIAGNRMGDIGYAVERRVRKYGCNILKDFAGHGIGLNMHEDPVVFHFGEPGTGIPVVPGMVFTIEPVVCLGKAETRILKDGWTMVTKDGSLSAQFEHTVAVFGKKTEVLTLSGKDSFKAVDFPPFF